MQKFILKRYARRALVIVFGFLFVTVAFRYDWFVLLDRVGYDLGLSARPRTDSESDVIVVAIDKYSRDVCFPPPEFPISAHVAEHAEVVRRLARAGARVIVLDILFDQLDPRLDVGPFVSAVGEAGNVILASVIEKRALKTSNAGLSIQEEHLALPAESIPPSLYTPGLVNMPLDSDQIVRRGYSGRRFQGKWIRSIPAAIAASSSDLGIKHVEPGSDFNINYSSPGSGFVTITYADILEGESWEHLVDGKIALIGVTENSISDIYKAPISGIPGATRGKMLPGVVILAYATQTLLRDGIISSTPKSLSFLFAMLIVLGSAFIGFGRRLAWSLGIAAALLVGALACGIAFTACGISVLPTGKLIAAALVTSVAGIIVNYWYTRIVSAEQEEELEEISTDLRAAKKIQQNLQPEAMPSLPGLEIAGFQIPCKAIGGDYYDVIVLDDAKLVILIADVSGKGISGALLMSNLQSSFRRLVIETASPSNLVKDLNAIASEVFSEGRFVTLFCGILDLASAKLSHCNAGHLPPLVCRADGEIVQFPVGGPPLGVLPVFDWPEVETQLQSEDLLFLYTDGLWEAAVERTGDQFGKDRIIDYMRTNRGMKPDLFNRQIVRTVQRFTGSEHLDDDITLLTLKVL